HELPDAAFKAFSQGHERLLDMFDAIAADQKLPDASREIRALGDAKPAAARDDLAAIDDERHAERPTQSAKVVEFPAFVRPPGPSELDADPVDDANDLTEAPESDVPLLEERVETALPPRPQAAPTPTPTPPRAAPTPRPAPVPPPARPAPPSVAPSI